VCVCVRVFRLFFISRDPNTPDDDDAFDNIDQETCPDRISRESGAARHKRRTIIDGRGEKNI